MKRIIIIGGGEHCRAIISLIKKQKSKIVGIIDDKLFDKKTQFIMDVTVLGKDSDIDKYIKNNKFIIGVGGIGDNTNRLNIFNRFKDKLKFISLISVDAIVEADSIIGEGSVIMPGAIINNGVSIGNNVIINTGAVVEHDCIIEDHVHISSGAVLSGGVTVKEGAHIGAGASIRNHITIGAMSTIGIGSAVVKDISDNVIAYGVPCKEVRKK